METGAIESREAVLERLRPFVKRAATGHPLAHAPVPLGDDFPWRYEPRARQLARLATRILDIGPGPGDGLARILEDASAFAVAAERRARHLADARDRLGGRASLVRAAPGSLPFPPATFDLVLSLHQPLEAEEVIGLIAPGGALLSQQIHARNWHELRSVFPRMPAPEDRFEATKRAFRRAGFEFIDARALDRPVAFRGLGELAYTLAASPWIVPDFSLEDDLDALLELEEEYGDERGILLTRSRYILEVRRPGVLE